MPSSTRRPAHLLSRVLVAAALVVLLATPALARDFPTIPIQGTDPSTVPIADQILVRYEAGTTAGQRRQVRESHGVRRLEVSQDRRTELVTSTGGSARLARGSLSRDPLVVAVSANAHRTLFLDPTTEAFWDEEWGLHNTGQTIDGIQEVTGTPNIDIDGLQAMHLHNEGGDPSVVVAVVDDGIDWTHPDLADRIYENPGESGGGKETDGVDNDDNGFVDDYRGWDFCDDDNDPQPATPQPPDYADGHGTHVAGTIAATRNGSGVVGVAPAVTLLPVRAFEDGVSCEDGDFTLTEAIAYATSFDVPVINASWGGPDPDSALDAAIGASGALVVVAAGNNGFNIDSNPIYPAVSTKSNVITVAAYDQKGFLASFSNYGDDSVDIGAPGTNILSAYPDISGSCAPCWVWSAGTSMATPHVAGVAALVVSQRVDEGFSALSPSALRGRLMSTGRDMPAANGKTVTDDLVNAYRAVDVAAPVTSRPNQFSMSAGSTIGSTSGAAIIRWPAAIDAQSSSIDHYSLKKKHGTTWTTVTSSTDNLLAGSNVTFGKSYLWRVRAYDPLGHNSAADSPTEKPTLHQDSSSLAHYGSGWSTKSSSSASGGKTHTTSTAGAQMTFTFTGRSVSIVSPKSSSRGSFDVYVDNVLTSTVNTNASSPKPRIVVFAKAWTSTATHTVKIVNKATVGHPRIDIDAFVVFRTQ